MWSYFPPNFISSSIYAVTNAIHRLPLIRSWHFHPLPFHLSSPSLKPSLANLFSNESSKRALACLFSLTHGNSPGYDLTRDNKYILLPQRLLSTSRDIQLARILLWRSLIGRPNVSSFSFDSFPTSPLLILIAGSTPTYRNFRLFHLQIARNSQFYNIDILCKFLL